MYTYIIIDDESLTRKGTRKKLEPLADTLTCAGEASNGKDAMELIQDVDPDIIITDMNMPVMDGTEFLPLLNKRYPNKQIIVISGYKDFDYTKQAIMAKAINYILKPFSREEIQSSALHAIQMIRDKANIQAEIISKEEEKEAACYEYDIQLLEDKILGYDTSEAKLTSKKLNLMNQTHNLILMTLYSEGPIEQKEVRIFLQEAAFGDLALYLPHKRSGNLGFLVLFLPNQSAISPDDLCRQVIHSLNYRFESNGKMILIGVSKPHASLLELHGAFEETIAALNARRLSDQQGSFFFEEPQKAVNEIFWDKTNEFLFRLEAGMTDRMTEMLEELFQYFLTVPQCTIADVKSYLFQLSGKVKVIVSYYFDQATQYSTPSSMQGTLDCLFSLEEIKAYYLRLLTNISEALKTKSVYATDDVVEKMKAYVKRNYSNEITVEYLSSLFYMNRSYCSHLFRARTGEKFVDFVNGIRIEKAKQLLRDSDKKMYQIAKAVGYDNVKYFFRVFNKLEKKTPEQFRMEQKAKVSLPVKWSEHGE
jgi:two-component system response regulator YesN